MNEALQYAYDPAGNLVQRSLNYLDQTFSIGPANQLTNVTREGLLTVTGATPAPAGSVTVNGWPAQTYADFTFASQYGYTLADGQNSFTNVAVNYYGTASVTNVVTANLPASVTLQYDANGNLTNDGFRSFGYDAENQLTNVSVAAQWRSDFLYDGLGRRRIERDYAWQTGAWVITNEVRFLYDGLEIVRECDSNNVPQITYSRGRGFAGSRQGTGGIGGLLARTDTNGSTFYHADGNGNVTGLIDTNQFMAARYLYDPFGRVIGKWGTLADANQMQFSSMPRDANSGLSLYPYRAYDSNLQRWLNRDPISEEGGINLYGFAGNNPVNVIDAYGLISSLDTPEGAGVMAWLAEQMVAGAAAGAAADVTAELSRQAGRAAAGDCDAWNTHAALDSWAQGAGWGAATGPLFGAAFEALAPVLRPVLRPIISAAQEAWSALGESAGAASQVVEGTSSRLAAADTGALRFSQTTASPWFSSEGNFAGQTISDVAGQLRAGTMSAADVPVQVVTMDGNTLIVNTRSSLALTQGGIPQSSWNLIDMTGNADVMNSIGVRLGNNGLTSAGTSTLRITGSGSGASTYFGAGTIPPPP